MDEIVKTIIDDLEEDAEYNNLTLRKVKNVLKHRLLGEDGEDKMCCKCHNVGKWSIGERNYVCPDCIPKII